MSNTIGRNATRKLAEARSKDLICHEHDISNHFEAVQCDPSVAWTKFDTFPRAQLSVDDDGKYTIRVHSNRWYKLEEIARDKPMQ